MKIIDLRKVIIDDIKFGQITTIDEEEGKKILFINKNKIIETIKKDRHVSDVKIHLAKPGESTRIISVKDCIEPRIALLDGENYILSDTLANVAIVTTGKIVAFQEGIIDMSGPGALHTPFSKTFNIVLEIDVIDNLNEHEHEKTIRQAGHYIAEYLAFEAISDTNVDSIERFSLIKRSPIENLPKVAYVYMLLSQGLLHDTFVNDVNAREENLLPTIIDPVEILAGAIKSGNCVSACDKNTTWHHQNNPVVKELLRLHGKKLNFVGVVLTNEPTKLAWKRSSAAKTIELVKSLNAEGVIITEEGFGNPEADLMMIIRGLEQAGIKTVCITDEYAGSDGASQSLADTTPEATGVISVGNANEIIELPPMTKIIGPVQDLTKLAGSYPHSLKEDGSLEVELQAIIGATNQLGHQKLSCREE